MAAPTQELPQWLSFSTTTETGANGVPLTTSTTLIYLPLTYLGPSIPLGTLFTFGGSTIPATILTAPTELPSPSPTSTSAIPPSTIQLTSSAISSTTSAPSSSIPTSIPSLSSIASSSLSSSLSSSASLTSSPITPSSTSTPSPSAGAISSSHGLSRGQLIGVILASVLGLIGIFGLCILLFLWRAGRRRSRRIRDEDFAVVTPIDDDYFMVGEGGKSPGEGSPRHSGEEADPFLRRERAGAGSSNVMQEKSPLLSDVAAGKQPAPPPIDGSLSSSNKTASSAESGYYGTLLDKPAVAIRKTPPEQRIGQILSPEQLRKLDEESVLPPPNTDFGPIMPARLTPPLLPGSHETTKSSMASMSPSLRAESSEHPSVMAARRVKVEELGLPPRMDSSSPPTLSSGPSNRRTSWRDAGLASLASITGLGWFKDLGSSSSKRSSYSGLQTSELSDRDVETGRALLASSQQASRSHLRPKRSGPAVRPTSRPISSLSTKSTKSAGAGSAPSVYHDARSSFHGTPTPALTPLPPAMTPASQAEIGMWPSRAAERRAQAQTHQQDLPQQPQQEQETQVPPKYDDPPPTDAPTIADSGIDVLDSPVPRGVSPFASISSLRDTATVSSMTSSLGKKLFPYPPGLLPMPTISGGGGGGGENPVNMDILEEEPPSPGANWRSLAVVIGDRLRVNEPAGRRTTFGMPRIPQSPAVLDEDHSSLNSMRSHLTPASSRSAGSAPASRRDGSNSSGSKRSARTDASGRSEHSLAHSNSITDDHRRLRSVSPRSPALSAFGQVGRPGGGHLMQLASESSGETGTGEARGHVQGPSDRSGPSSPLLAVAPWATGLDDGWTPS